MAEQRRWSTRDLLRAIVLFFAIAVALLFLWFTRSFIITAFLGFLLSLPLISAADWLEQRFGVRRGLAVAGVVLLSLGVLAGFFALMAPQLKRQGRELAQRLPQALTVVEKWIGVPAAQPQQPQAGQPAHTRQPQAGQRAQVQHPQPAERPSAARQQQQPQQLRSRLAGDLKGLSRFIFPFVSGVVGAIAGIIVVLFVAIYVATDPGLYRRGLLHLIPLEARPRSEALFEEIGDALRRWLVARLIAMVLIGTITAVALTALRVKGALALGVIAGLLEFIPFFGPFLAAVPALGAALVDSPQKALWVALVYVVIQQLEGNLITPLLLKRRLEIPPAVTIAAAGTLGIVFGVLGMLIAEPLAAVAMILTRELYVRDIVGDEVDGAERD